LRDGPLKATPPTGLAGIEPATGSRALITAFGEAVVEVIEQSPEQRQAAEGCAPYSDGTDVRFSVRGHRC